jgi:hypothetical protein
MTDLPVFRRRSDPFAIKQRLMSAAMSGQRIVAPPFDGDRERLEASFKTGALVVRLPKTAAAKSERRRTMIKGG